MDTYQFETIISELRQLKFLLQRLAEKQGAIESEEEQQESDFTPK